MSNLSAFVDPDVEPTAELIQDALADTAPQWNRLMEAVAGPDFGLTPAWRHYSDGGWLAKLQRGSKNLAWLSVWDGYGRITFYFPGRYRETLTALAISETLRDRIESGPLTGRSLGVPIDIRSESDVDDALEVLAAKLSAK